MRKYKESIVIKLVFGVIVLSFIGTIFLVWGKGDQGSGERSSGYIAKVDGTKISYQTFAGEYDQMRKMYQQFGGLTPELEKKLNLKKTVLDNLIDTILVRQAAKKMGIKVSNEELRKSIAEMAYFQKDGAFDPKQYQQVLSMNRLTPSAFEDQQRESLLNKKALQKVKDGVQVTEADLTNEFHKRNDRLNIAFVSFSPADVRGEVQVSEQEMQSYLQSHSEEFRLPEQLRLSYVLIDPARITGIAVTDEEANVYYQKNIDRYQGKGGILPFAEVKEKAKSDAARNKAAKQAYENAADAVNRNLKTANLAAAADSLKAKVADTPLFSAKNPPAALAGETELLKRAFALKQGELGGPVETPRGIYILKSVEKKPADVPPLAQVKGEVEKKVRDDKARALAKKKAEDAVAQLTKGDAGKLQETGLFSYADKDVPKIGAAPELKEAAFALAAATPVAKTPFQVGDRWFAIRMKERVAASNDDFQKNKEQLRTTLLPKMQEEAVKKWLKELREKAKIEIDPKALTD